MHIIRPIEWRDEHAFLELALSSAPGILTLPRDPLRIKQKLADSVKSFISDTQNSSYIFVLENVETQQIEGCSALLKTVNQDNHYTVETIEHPNRIIEQIPYSQKLLTPQIIPENISEICTLFLSRNCRKSGLGRLLSLSRFMFVACHRERFENTFMAEMRGVIDQAGISPFWEGVGKHFCNVDFKTISAMYEADPRIAKAIMPTHPLYWNLLPKETQEVIGKTHPDTIPALKMLESQGFKLCDWIDILDGGPRVRAITAEIKTIKTSTHAPVLKITQENLPASTRIISNRKIDFRCCYGNVIIEDDGVTIDGLTAKNLNIEKGEMICFTEEKK